MSHRDLPPDPVSQPETGPQEDTDAPNQDEAYRLLLGTRAALGSQAGWQDAVQQSAERLLRHPPVRAVSKAWAQTVVRNALESERRAQRAQKRGAGRSTIPLEKVDVEDPAADPLQALLRAEQRAWLTRAVGTLKPKERRVLALVLRGLTSPEIAQALETTDNAVRALYRRGLEKLHALAEKERRTQS